MKVILFGASGMLGQAALLEAVDAPDVERILAVVRRPLPHTPPKVEELVLQDFADLSGVKDRLAGMDACFYCLGATAAGLDEAAYTVINHDYPVAAGRALLEASPGITFCYISGAGTDATEQGRAMWARVKGRTENDLLRMGFRAVHMLRPGYIQPTRGVVSGTALYRAIYAVTSPLYPLVKAAFPKAVVTSAEVGQALLLLARGAHAQAVLEPQDINALLAAPR